MRILSSLIAVFLLWTTSVLAVVGGESSTGPNARDAYALKRFSEDTGVNAAMTRLLQKGYVVGGQASLIVVGGDCYLLPAGFRSCDTKYLASKRFVPGNLQGEIKTVSASIIWNAAAASWTLNMISDDRAEELRDF